MLLRALLFLLLLLLFEGCAVTRLADASTLSDSEFRQLLIGHWYAQAFADKGQPLLNWVEADYRADGSCVYTYMHRAIDPRTNKLVTARGNQGVGRWRVSRGKLIEHWEGRSFPANRDRISTARILRVGANQFDVKEEPFDSYVTYYRHLTIIPLNS